MRRRQNPGAIEVRELFFCTHWTSRFLTEKQLAHRWTRNTITTDKFYHDSSILWS